MTTVLITLAAVIVALLLLAAGFHIGVKAAYNAVSNVARTKMNDADYDTFIRLFDKVRE